jgi:hypothetical protein
MSDTNSCEITLRYIASVYRPGTNIINENSDWEFDGFYTDCGLDGVNCNHPAPLATEFDWNAETDVLAYSHKGVRYEIEGKEGEAEYTTSQNLNHCHKSTYHQRADTVRAKGGWIARSTNQESTVGDASGDQRSGQGGSSTLKPGEQEKEAQEEANRPVHEEPFV